MTASLLPREAAPVQAVRRAWPVLAALAGSVLLLLAALSAITVRTDMTAFLPQGGTDAARLVLDEAREGSASGLILLGIEGTDPAALARISRDMAASLEKTGLFRTVAGGDAAVPRAALETLFARRYLLADADWSEAGLRAGLQRLLAALRGAAAPLAAEYGVQDPVGASLPLMRAWQGNSTVRSVDGAWFASDRDRALLLLQTKAGGLDVPGQEAASTAIERAFAAAQPGGARLLEAGPAVFTRDSARAIRGDVRRISVVSTLLVALLLLWRFRSPLVIAAIAAPVVASVAVAAFAVQLLFGSVHGVALGFGATMLGISVDYPVLLLGHRKRGEPAPATRRRIGRAFVLAVVTAALGLAAMIFSGFPGLVQLGAFAAIGLLACALLTWFGLPRLIVAAGLAPVASGDPVWLHRLERLRRYRWWALVPAGAAAAFLLAVGGPRWQGNLEALSPVPEATRQLDAELRSELGAPDVGQVLLVRGADPEAVLKAEEALRPTLDRLRTAGAIAGWDDAADLVPSAARQRARQAALPDDATLAARLDAARAGLPFRPEAFAPFLQAVAPSRTLPPLRPTDLAGTALAARLEPLLEQRGAEWRGPVVLHGVADPAAVASAVAGTGAVFIDIGAELGQVLASYTGRAVVALAASGAAMLLVLATGLRNAAMAARVIGSVLLAVLLTVTTLTAFGAELSVLHLVALQLVAGVGLDYALFFARRQLDGEERARTMRTLVTCNALTLLTFGLLALCRTPLLRDIGITVACGAVLAVVAAFFVTGEPPGEAA